jgi:2-amino-4-hydroxy-6-hydroxymethyldihydropteridine diphosphokinase
MHERRFVLIPMVDLDPDLEHPLLGKSMSELLMAIPEKGQIVKSIEDH